jgi:hypothetical protein
MAEGTQAAYRKPNGTGPAILLSGDGLHTNNDERRFSLGTKAFDVDGNTYRYILAGEALARGQVVTAVALAAWDSGILVDGAVTAGDTLIHVDTITTAANADAYAGYWIGQAPAAGPLGALHRIKSHSAMAASGEVDLYLDDSTPAAEAFANNAAVLIFHPWKMELCDATTETIRGVVVNTIDSGSYGFIQTGGFVPSVLTGHSTSAAVVLDEYLTPLATPAGSVQGAAGNAEADIMEASASRLIALEAVAANTICHIPAYFIGEV